MRRKICIVLLVTLILSLTALVFVACGDTQEEGFTVTFVAEGKTVKVIKCDKGATAVDEPAVPSKTGYTGAWESYTLTKDLTVHAIYTAKQYTVTFNYNGADGTYQAHTTVTYDKAVGALPEPAKTNNYFAGWYLNGDRMTADSIWQIDSDTALTFTAKWVPSSQAITYTYNKSAMTCTVSSIYATMTEVVVPSTYNGYTVTAIADGAFADSRYLTGVTISATVSSIGEGVFVSSVNGLFESTKTITSLSVDPNSEYFYSEGNCVIDKNSLSVVVGATTSEIPSNVKRIGNGAFAGVNMRTIELPSGIQDIASGAFRHSAITSITIPDSVKSLGSSVFYSCTKLQTVTFGDASQIKSIPSYAFYNCKELKQIAIPDSVVTIEPYAFYGCGEKLNKVSFGANSNLKTIGQSAFAYCYVLQEVHLPSKLEVIDEYGFYSCSELTTVTIPASITAIEYNAFAFSGPNGRLESIYYEGTWEDLLNVKNGPQLRGYANNLYVRDSNGEWVKPD